MSRVALFMMLGTAATSSLANLVTNGSFENTNVTTTSLWGHFCQPGVAVNNWSSNSVGQGIVLPSWQPGAPGTGVLFPAGNACYGGNAPVGLAGPVTTSSPDGGNFVFSDGDPTYAGNIDQTISGLTAGVIYTLKFLQALAQETETSMIGNYGPVTGHWDVSFVGGAVQSSSTMTANGLLGTWSPWAQQTMTFVATGLPQVLRFHAIGTGLPPFLLLDGVNLEQQVPEPSSLALVLLAGIASASAYRRTRWLRDAPEGMPSGH